MSCCEKAKAALRPVMEELWKCFEERNYDKAIELYHPHAVLVERGKRGFYGKDDIKKQFIDYDKQKGKCTLKSWNDEHYQMTEDYIIVDGHYETQTEKAGVIKGEFNMIWKKSNGKYLVKRDEYTEN
ncbi:unnamed protein product [Cylicocyclus nassatus]|uniref:DUF4440 domain-containing protein n=1 Tax=Cylicocyclus nassatus TaxID=53992 RepID=A0AA36M9I9_CYLNA|nr:unnamed protein product [Cylicocyclus nassatus]